MKLGMSTRKGIVVLSVLFIGGVILYFSTLRRPNIEVVWGSSKPPVSEQAYYLHRIHGLIESWMRRHSSVSRVAANQTEPVALVIDTEQKRLWMQEGSYVSEEGIIGLAPGLSWTLYHITPQGDKTYSGRLRLKLPAPSFRPKPRGGLYLVGQGEESSLVYQFGLRGIQSCCQPGIFQLSAIERLANSEEGALSESDEGTDAPSLLVQVEAIENFFVKELTNIGNDNESLLYKVIETELVNRGYTLSGMEVVPGPGDTAGYAQVFFKTDQERRWYQWIMRFFQMNRDATGVDLLYDEVVDRVWYVCSMPESMPFSPVRRPNFTGRLPNVEFLVPTRDATPSYDEQTSLSLGRTRVDEAVSKSVPASSWKLRLSSGIGVEVIGLCKAPNQGSDWWGPDGSLFEAHPGFIIEPQKRPPPQFQVFPSGMSIQSSGFTMQQRADKGIAMVCRIHLPPGHTSIRRKLSSTAFSFRLSKPFMTLAGNGPILNRYGISIDKGHYRTFIFEDGENPIQYGFGIRSGTGNVPNYGFAWVAFRNVAGSPGQTTDFQITEETGLGAD